MTPTPKETAMNDQTTPDVTDNDRRLAYEWAKSVESTTNPWSDRTLAVARVLKALLPTPATLADMTDEERAACQWMQADTKLWGRVVIVLHNAGVGRAMTLDRRGHVAYEDHDTVTPRPDLPRMEWPDTEKPAPAPALPDGWRLADHPDYGRVIVTNTTPNPSGHVYFVGPADDSMGCDRFFCDPARLTYLDQEDGTSDAVPESTLAVGSVWYDADTLAEACRESGRDQIIALDRDGDAFVWDEMAEWWEGSVAPRYAPYTIIHAGKKADQ